LQIHGNVAVCLFLHRHWSNLRSSSEHVQNVVNEEEEKEKKKKKKNDNEEEEKAE